MDILAQWPPFPIVVLVMAFIFIVLEWVPKVVVVLLGASALLMSGVVTQSEAISYIDFNVIALLLGMMILVNILKQTGAVNALAIYAVKRCGASGLKIFLVFSVLTAILSALLDNVTVVLLMGLVTIHVAQRLKLPPVPFLIAEAIMSNVGGAATLIGDPPNIMIGSAAGLNFNDFLVNLAPIILLMCPIVLMTLAWMYAEQLEFPQESVEILAKLHPAELIRDRALMRKALAVIGLVIAGFLFHERLHVENGTIALAGASLLMLFENGKDLWDDVEWMTLFFFIGLFIIVGAVVKMGAIAWLAQHILHWTHDSFAKTTLLLLWVSGILSALIDNIPYTATVIPMVKEFAKTYPHVEPMWWALALGACLGGNGTLIGASANVVIADMANRHQYPIHFREFMKVGMLIMVETLLISTLYLWLRYLH